MAREGDETGSFDPKSWAQSGEQPEAAPKTPAKKPPGTLGKRTAAVPVQPATGPAGGTAGRSSFDPKTWAGGADPTSAAVPPEATVPPAAPPPRAAAMPSPGRGMVAGAFGASVLLLAGGAAAALIFPSSPTAVAEAATTTPLAAATADAPLANASRRTLVVASAADIADALATTGIPRDIATGAAAAAAAALGVAAGDVRLVLDLIGPDNARQMTRLEATRDDGSGVVLTAHTDGSFASETRQARLTTEVRVVRGEMDATSFYNAAVTAGVTDSLVSDIAKAFAFDFNFATDVKAGDIFEAAFEQKINPAGEEVGPPTLIYVSLQTSAKSKSLYRFLAPGETEPGWFDGNGRSTVTALMRTPVDGARITSNFGPRFHPVLHYNRLHGGTDFAAPVGTPVYSSAGGIVVSASPSNCAGNMVIVRHDNGWETRYFHLSRYADGVVAGARVTQGFTIGDVGNTGTCTTGPHLHYEVHIKGEKVDPMGIDTGSGRTLSGDALTAFRKERDRIDVSRAAS